MSTNNCSNCYYSKTYDLCDPIIEAFIENSSVKDLARKVLSSTTKVTKCHYAGKPQVVNGKEDWCHQWKEKQ